MHVLQVGKNAAVGKRYHANHDLALFAVSGNAIVEVEGERHFLESPGVVVIRRLWSYELIPHRTDENFVALLVYSPPFRGEDIVLMED
jgi:mannose-6-phosphate isomerase-like protein (cupin superfamily)